MADAPAPPEDAPALEACGFVQVPADGDEQLWMTCDACGKSDHFWLDRHVRCRCGARYDHAVRPDGVQVPVDQLRFVPFREGPMQLADLEWDPLRLGAIVVAVLAVLGAVAWLVF